MSDFHTLTEAFTELERRADVVSAHAPVGNPSQGRRSAPEALTTITLTPAVRPRRLRPALLAGTAVAAVLAVATGTVLVARGGDSSSRQAASGPTSAPSTAARPTTPAVFQVPTTSRQLVARFQAVLGGTAGLGTVTFTVRNTDGPVGAPSLSSPSSTPASLGLRSAGGESPSTPAVAANQPDSSGAAIVGTLTAAGVTGGFDLQVYRDTPLTSALCDDPGSSHCTTTTLADGSRLAIGQEPVDGGGVTYQATVARRDGVVFRVHVSNQRDPKGDSSVLAARPPLTTAQLTTILTSPRW